MRNDSEALPGVTVRPHAIDVRAWSLYLGLTAPFAILAHLAFDITDAGLTWAVFLRPAHLGLLGLALGAVSAASYGLGYGLPGAERRRRLGLVRAALRADRSPLRAAFIGAVVQTMIVLSTLSLDDAALHPERVAMAAFAGLLAVLVGTLAISVAERHVLDFALARPRRAARRADTPFGRPRVLRAAVPLTLFRPMRAPPLLTEAP